MKYIKILRFNHRNTEKKKELEACIELLDAAPDGASSSYGGEKGKEKAKGGASSAFVQHEKEEEATNVGVASQRIVSDIFAQLYQHLNDEALIAAVKAKEQDIRVAVQPQVENRLIVVRNDAYSGGFFARAPAHTHHQGMF